MKKGLKLFKRNTICLLTLLAGFVSVISATAQQKQAYDLHRLARENKLITRSMIQPVSDGEKRGIKCTSNVWLKDINFSEGTIEIEIKGKDLFQNSFVGMAFHAVDTVNYDCIYFRPFNFQSADTARRSHSVQYINPPTYEWFNLREQFPGKYENSIDPPPLPDKWFHAKIVVEGSKVKVYVNGSKTPSLEVEKLNKNRNGMLGLWTVGAESQFANLRITTK